jgi:hypothetical protein
MAASTSAAPSGSCVPYPFNIVWEILFAFWDKSMQLAFWSITYFLRKGMMRERVKLS